MVEARAQLVKELSGAVAAAGPTNHVCRALLGAGFFWFGASSFRWCAVRPVGYASTWMLAALVPVLLGAGGCMTDWNGDELTIAHHEASKGRVVAAANEALHTEALALLKIEDGGSGAKRLRA